ncbi:arsenate reductase/protein-tyrosine-phosphatase family protein [Sphaerisporangium rufum]|nr:protein-tyrosine-phosphatase [Sphaerisporangium rufum]
MDRAPLPGEPGGPPPGGRAAGGPAGPAGPAPSDGDGPARFGILFVCTGNLCRSPIAERLTRAALGPDSPIVAASAGTDAVDGAPMSTPAVHVLRQAGADSDGFAARRLTAGIVREADLVLTAAQSHRARVARLHPRGAGRMFTIVEFGTLAAAVDASTITCHADPVARAGALLAAVRARRGLVQVEQPDIPDPYGAPAFAYRLTARRLTDALRVPLALLTAPVTRRRPASAPC